MPINAVHTTYSNVCSIKEGKFNCFDIVDEFKTNLKIIINDEYHEPFDDFLDCIKDNANDKNCGYGILNATFYCIELAKPVIVTRTFRVNKNERSKHSSRSKETVNIECNC